MGVDFHPCSVCQEISPDTGYMWNCAKCGEYVFECCYEEQEEKYGTVEDGSEDADYYGEEALKQCDGCSEETKATRIAALEQKLKELKGE